VVFYDQNGDNSLDSTDYVRFPNTEVDVAGQSGSSQAGGDATVTGVPSGLQTVTVKASTLPPYYQAGQATVQIPQETSNPIAIPVTLPIGKNLPNVYMAFGDSITIGDGSSFGTGYRDALQDQLESYFTGTKCTSTVPSPTPTDLGPNPVPSSPQCAGAGSIVDEGVEATRTNKGAERIAATLAATQPAFVLIHYGTNDWNEQACKDAPPCYTIDNLKFIVETAKANNTFPFLATIIPVNVGFDVLAPPSRDVWVHNQDVLIRQLAADEGVVLVDLEAAFLNAFTQNGGNYQEFFSDHVHPSDKGYAVMAQTFFDAITKRSASQSASLGAFELRRPE
jgi:lysophospholipase L1-like esterase